MIMQNVSPAHAPDIVIYLDAITVIFEEAHEGGPPLSLPTVCIEAGNDHRLPDLALRLIPSQIYYIFSLTKMTSIVCVIQCE